MLGVGRLLVAFVRCSPGAHGDWRDQIQDGEVCFDLEPHTFKPLDSGGSRGQEFNGRCAGAETRADRLRFEVGLLLFFEFLRNEILFDAGWLPFGTPSLR